MAQDSSPVSCHEIAVIGAVKTPGRFKVQGRIRLSEVLTLGGGPISPAGRVVHVLHICSCYRCSESEAKDQKGMEYDLSATLQGRESANPYVQVGDLVIVPEAEFVSVIGNALRQQTFVYREGVTLTRAIALAGGVVKSSDLVRVKIRRPPYAGQSSDTKVVNLKAILQGSIEDPILRPYDILEVSDERGFFLDNSFRLSPPLGDPPLIQRRSPNC